MRHRFPEFGKRLKFRRAKSSHTLTILGLRRRLRDQELNLIERTRLRSPQSWALRGEYSSFPESLQSSFGNFAVVLGMKATINCPLCMSRSVGLCAWPFGVRIVAVSPHLINLHRSSPVVCGAVANRNFLLEWRVSWLTYSESFQLKCCYCITCFL